MKVLFSLQPAPSHLHPLLALADGLAAAGHEIRFATAESFRATVEKAGFCCVAAGIDWKVAEGEKRFPELGRLTGEALDRFWFCEVFGAATPGPMARDLAAVIEEFSPDVMVHDMYELGGPLAAERAGIPCATHAFGHFTSRRRMQELVGEAFGRARRELGLREDGQLSWLWRDLYLDFVPEEFQRERVEVENAHRLRPIARENLINETSPRWLEEMRGGPTAYVTLGTVFNRAPEMVRGVVKALRSVCRNIVVTVGENGETEIGVKGVGIFVERYVPQRFVLPKVDLVVCHGGFNTVMGALAHGVPVLCLPRQADQGHNAEAVARLGLGRELGRGTEREVFAAAQQLLIDTTFRARVKQFQETLRALPAVERAVALVEELGQRGGNSVKP